MIKLHQLLAAESTLEKAANKLIKESIKTFTKENLFQGVVRILEMFKDEDKKSETTEYLDLTTTVDENINYLIGPVSDWYNATLRKEKTNQSAIADLIVNGTLIAKEVPATFLLGLEKRLIALRTLYEGIPALQPGIEWKKDTQGRAGTFKTAKPSVSFKTRKDPEFRTVAKATEQHPAQVQQIDRVADVGKYISTTYSGRLAPIDKANRLAKIDALLVATKMARMKANDIIVPVSDPIGEAIFNFINK